MEKSGAGVIPHDQTEEFIRGPGSVWLLKLAHLKEDGWPITQLNVPVLRPKPLIVQRVGSQ